MHHAWRIMFVSRLQFISFLGVESRVRSHFTRNSTSHRWIYAHTSTWGFSISLGKKIPL